MNELPAGRLLSLWAATGGTANYASLDASLDVDVAVIGGGIAGLTAALALKRAGQTVAVLEAARVGTGVTGNTTGKVTSLHRLAYSEIAARHGAGTAATYGQANEAAIEHIAAVVAAEGIDCGFRRVANYTYAESGPALALVREEAALAGRLGLPASFTTDVPLPFAVMGAVRFDGQAQIHALRYVQGLARAVNGDGSFVFEESPATGFRDGSPAVVATDRGSVRAKEIIVATNLPFGDHGLFAERCYAHRSYIVACRSAAPPLDATFVSVDEPMRSILTVDVEGTSYVLAGGEGHPATASVDSAERYRRLAAFAGDRLGAGEIVFRWSTQDAMPARRAALRGPNVSGVPACPRDHRAAKMGPHQRHGRCLDPAGHAVRHAPIRGQESSTAPEARRQQVRYRRARWRQCPAPTVLLPLLQLRAKWPWAAM